MSRSGGVIQALGAGAVAALLAAGAARGAAAAGASPQVQVLELGHHGRASASAAVTARIVITATSPFEGRLDAVLRTGEQRLPDRRGVIPPRCLSAAALEVRFPGPGTRRATLVFPETQRALWSEGPIAMEWKLLDHQGASVREGRTGGRLVQPGRPWEDGPRPVLFLTDRPGEGVRRSPAEAFESAGDYRAYDVTAISGTDLAALEPGRRQPLLDAAASGMTLLLLPPGAPMAAIDERLAAADALVWTDLPGEEVREAFFLFGVLRRSTLDPWDVEDAEKREALLALLLQPSSARPRPVPVDHRATVSRVAAEYPVGWAHRLAFRHLRAVPALDPEQVERVARRMAVAVTATGACALLVAMALWRASSAARPLARRATLRLVAATVVLPLPVYAVLVEARAGNLAESFAVSYHGPGGVPQVRDVTAAAGGGGGSADPVLGYTLGPRTSLRVELDSQPPGDAPLARAIQDQAGHTRLVSERWAPSKARTLSVTLRSVAPADPPVVEDLRWEGGRLRGTVRARRSLEHALVAFPLGYLRLGSLDRGGSLDLGTLEPRPWSERLLPEEEAAFVHAVPSRFSGRWTARADAIDLGLLILVARDPQTRLERIDGVPPAAAGSFAFQALRAAGQPPVPRLALSLVVPALRRGSVARVCVPERLWGQLPGGLEARLALHGTGASPDPIPRQLGGEVRHGFRILEREVGQVRTWPGHAELRLSPQGRER